MYLRRQGEMHVVSSCRSQSGGLGKHAGRNIKRTMQPRNRMPRQELLAEAGVCGWRLVANSRKPGIAVRVQREDTVDHRGGVDGMHGKYGKRK
jgi:hypothetical protein